jgi:hypothetical protein
MLASPHVNRAEHAPFLVVIVDGSGGRQVKGKNIQTAHIWGINVPIARLGHA